MSSWMPVNQENSVGVAIHNYQEDGEFRVKLTVGECVHISRECKDWYYGYAAKNKDIFGIFPRSFIRKMNLAFYNIPGTVPVCALADPLLCPAQSHIIVEVTSVLREWGVIWKKLYVTNNPHFKTIEHKMYDLIRLRSKILSGALPVDELKEIKRVATWNIDVGNKLLGLDMVVRDDQGNILNPDQTSAIELFRNHENATQRMLTPSCDVPETVSYQSASQLYNYTLFLSVRNLVCKVGEDIELLMTLYDVRLSKPFSENFVIRWTRDMFLSETDKFHNFRALFTDLGGRDLSREKVYLVCYVIRNGSMDPDQNNKNHKNSVISIGHSHTVRRPLAVTAFNLTPFLSGISEMDEDKHNFLPLLPCDKDNLEGTLKRCLSIKEFPPKDSKGQGLICSFKLLTGDIRQVREENPHLVFGNTAVVRKMGFPEVILPGDVRNDLYLTICFGEFTKGVRGNDKNIEVIVTVCTEKGVPLQGGIMVGAGVDPETEYHSVVYHHEDKPRWFETFKVAIPIEDFKGCHLKFLFKHRSSNETKDKNEKPFAFSFVKLMQDIGTTLRDDHHELLVYKVDQKKYDPMDIGYLSLASTRKNLTEGLKVSMPGLVSSNKDYFIIHTNVCSTKLTQNVDLLGLLNWTSNPNDVADSLRALMKVCGEEVVKFLQDVLDTLFNILMFNMDSEYDNMVFKCLLYVFGLVLDIKYLHFQPVLDLYIQESFSATLAYNKLIIVLKEYVDDVTKVEKDLFLNMMKSLKYIVRFITRSRFLFSELNENKGNGEFEIMFTKLLNSIAAMMHDTTDSTLLLQGACLKHLPSTIPDILTVYNPILLSQQLMILIHSVPNARLTKQKMMTINDIVHSPLFMIPECRAVLLPGILKLVKHLLQNSDEGKLSAEHRRYKSKSVAKIAKVLGTSSYDLVQPPDETVSQLELSIKILSDIMDLLYKPEAGSVTDDIVEIILAILRIITQTIISMDRESIFVGNLVSVMISIFRQMTPYHFDVYINHFQTHTDLLDFLMEILLVFKDLVSRPVYPKDWCEMILLQNSVILKALRCFSITIRDYFSRNFAYQLWNNFFHCAVSFLTQPALQLETFSPSKRWRIISRYKDMRRSAGFEIRIMWFNLGHNKRQFIPSLVSPFLQMTLIPEEELRKATIPIFFDMMQCEFYCNQDGILDRRHDPSQCKANFSEFENEMIAKLDNLVESGSGDDRYKELFHDIMIMFCEEHSSLKDQGIRFVNIVTGLMERLLEYRSIINDESKENRMNCIVNLLDFYSEINRKEMYIRYVNKLCAIHLECDNYTEAACTLKLHSNLLAWADTPLSPFLRTPKYPDCETHRQLKEHLYQDMIAYFDKGKMWERAIPVCKELVRQYEEETFDYCQLSTLLRRMSQFYDCILKQLRPEPEYFRVAYYGKGFPRFLRNKVFVHRGKEYERLSDFCSRILNQLPNAELLNKLTPPSSEITESNGQYVQINSVEPIMEDRKRLLNKTISEQILRYHRVNNVYKFCYSRPFLRIEVDGEENNEFANLWLERTIIKTSCSLPGVLRWAPVNSAETCLISPLNNAIETMEKMNTTLREMIISYKNDSTLPLNPLSMKLIGIVDPAVMGGIKNYEKAFFNMAYLVRHPEDEHLIEKLKDLIANQVPLLNAGIIIHGQRAPLSLAPLHQRIEDQFEEMKARIEEKYGRRSCDIKFESIKMRRHTTVGNTGNGHLYNSEDRLSAASTSSVEGRSLRSFVNLNTFSSTPTLSRNQSKPSLISTNSLSSSIAMFAAPVLSNSSVSPQKFGTIGSLTKKEKKEKKKRRNRTESKVCVERDSVSSMKETSSNSQWYTSDVDSISVTSANSGGFPMPPSSYEFLHDVTPKKIMELDKRSSRPSSDGSFPLIDTSIPLQNDSCDSFAADSTASEEDRIPPPLPAKSREIDYFGIMTEIDSIISSSPLTTPPTPPRNLFIKDEQINDSPPTPPPKKPHHKIINQTSV